MQIQEVMTKNPECANPNTPLQQVAQMMIECDCGGIPVCDAQTSKLTGFVTDRDIVCRVLAQGKNPLDATAQDAMTTDLHTLTPESSIDDCIKLMKQYKVKRVPVVDQQGFVVGIVSESDLTRRVIAAHPELTEEFEEALEDIYEPKVNM